MIEEGRIVLFPFPQTDRTTGKLRPALVLRRCPGPHDDWLICMISSQLRHEIPGVDTILHPDDADFAQTGLKLPSVIRVTRLAVVASSMLQGQTGRCRTRSLAGFVRASRTGYPGFTRSCPRPAWKPNRCACAAEITGLMDELRESTKYVPPYQVAEKIQEAKEEQMERGMRKGIREGEVRGREKGKQEGLQEGEERGRLEVAIAALDEEMEIGIVARISGLSEEEIRELSTD